MLHPEQTNRMGGTRAVDGDEHEVAHPLTYRGVDQVPIAVAVDRSHSAGVGAAESLDRRHDGGDTGHRMPHRLHIANVTPDVPHPLAHGPGVVVRGTGPV